MNQALSLIWSILLVLLICGTVFVILSSNSDSGKKVSWILVVTLLPAIGIILYIVFGLDMRNPAYYMKKHKPFFDAFERNADERTKKLLFGTETERKIREGYRDLSRLLTNGNGTTVCEDNRIEVITSGRRKFDALVNDILNAKHHIHMEYFYFKQDDGSKRIKELLMKRQGKESRSDSYTKT